MGPDTFNKFIALLVLYLLPITIFADEVHDAKALMQKALTFSEQTAYTAEVADPTGVVPNDQTGNATIYRKPTPSGYVVRAEIPLNDRNMIIVINDDGRFQFSEQSTDVAHMNYANPLAHHEPAFLIDMRYGRSFDIANVAKNEHLTYEFDGEVNYKSIPCYKVTLKMPTDNETLALMTNRSVEEIAANKELIMTHSPMVIQCLIGKDKPFLHSVSFYTAGGDILMSRQIDDRVTFSTDLADSLFELPKNATITEVKSQEEWQNFMTKVTSIEKKEAKSFSPRILIIPIAASAICLCVILVIMRRKKSA